MSIKLMLGGELGAEHANMQGWLGMRLTGGVLWTQGRAADIGEGRGHCKYEGEVRRTHCIVKVYPRVMCSSNARFFHLR